MSAIKIAVICQEGLQLEALLDSLAESLLSDVELQLVGATQDSLSASAMFDGRPIAFELIDDVDFSDCRLVIVLESALVVEAYSQVLQSIACPVLGFERDLAALSPEPLKHPVDPEAVSVIGLQQPAVLALASVFEGLDVEALDVTAFYPVSLFGKAGVNELASQTAKLLNAQSLEHQVFETQMPFNYFPLSSMEQMGALESQLSGEFVSVFDTDDVHFKAFQMPVFHGQGLSVSAVLADEIDIEKLQDNFENNPAIEYRANNKNLSNYDVVQLPGRILVGDLRKSHVDEHRLDLWMGFDENQFAIGQSLISVAELLLKRYL